MTITLTNKEYKTLRYALINAARASKTAQNTQMRSWTSTKTSSSKGGNSNDRHV